MTKIFLTTVIDAPVQVCFDLSRSIDLHQLSTKQTNEKAIAGKTSGLIEQGEYVKWRATHFFLAQTMTVQINKMTTYEYFEDEMIQGPFKSMKHLHLFETIDRKTIIKDEFAYEVPYGFFGQLF